MSLNYVDVPYSAVAITTTPATIVGVKASAHVALRWLESCVTLNGATSTATPATIEICSTTFATNAPGTNSTAITVANGKRDAARDVPQFTAAFTWTAEPTVVTSVRTIYDPQYMGVYHYINPITAPYIIDGAGGGSIRATASANVSCAGHMTVEE